MGVAWPYAITRREEKENLKRSQNNEPECRISQKISKSEIPATGAKSQELAARS